MWEISGPKLLIVGDQIVNIDKVEYMSADTANGGTWVGMTSGKRICLASSISEIREALKVR